MPPATTAAFSEILAPGLRGIVGTDLKSRMTFYSQFCNVETSNRNYEDILAAAGLPIAPQKTETGAIQSINPLEGNKKRIDFEEWGIGFEVSQTAWEDDLYAGAGSPLRDAATGLSSSLAERVEIEAHRPFMEGFAGTTFAVLPSDTTSLFNTAHAPVSGGEAANQANTPTTQVDLSVTSYRAGLTTFENYVNDRGLRIPDYTMPNLLIVAPAERWNALEITGSTNRPDTANRVENVTRGLTNVMVTPYITDDDSWFLQGSKHFFNFYWRSRPRMDNFDDRRRRIAVFVAWERFRMQPVHWLGMYGSQGA